MGLFDKFKKIFTKEEKEELKVYDKGLEKTRNTFLDALSKLNLNSKKIDEEYFEKLEEIFIMADIGVNTVMDIIDKLKVRVKKKILKVQEN